MKDIKIRDKQYIEEQIIKIKKCIETDEREIKYYNELIKENKIDIERYTKYNTDFKNIIKQHKLFLKELKKILNEK